ncbi:unnamed protein product [Closterium sp. Yama58-4]|nr:unnamed protein product [Closterium sp. Yama58-4]
MPQWCYEAQRFRVHLTSTIHFQYSTDRFILLLLRLTVASGDGCTRQAKTVEKDEIGGLGHMCPADLSCEFPTEGMFWDHPIQPRRPPRVVRTYLVNASAAAAIAAAAAGNASGAAAAAAAAAAAGKGRVRHRLGAAGGAGGAGGAAGAGGGMDTGEGPEKPDSCVELCRNVPDCAFWMYDMSSVKGYCKLWASDQNPCEARGWVLLGRAAHFAQRWLGKGSAPLALRLPSLPSLLSPPFSPLPSLPSLLSPPFSPPELSTLPLTPVPPSASTANQRVSQAHV